MFCYATSWERFILLRVVLFFNRAPRAHGQVAASSLHRAVRSARFAHDLSKTASPARRIAAVQVRPHLRCFGRSRDTLEVSLLVYDGHPSDVVKFSYMMVEKFFVSGYKHHAGVRGILSTLNSASFSTKKFPTPNCVCSLSCVRPELVQ